MGKGAGRTEELCQVLGGSANVGVPENLESAVCAFNSDLMSASWRGGRGVCFWCLYLRESCVCVVEGSP